MHFYYFLFFAHKLGFLSMPGRVSRGNIGRCLSGVVCAVVVAGHTKRAGMLAVSTAARLIESGFSIFFGLFLFIAI